jgi:phosphate acetyltransferase
MRDDVIENRTFDEIEVGDSAGLQRRLTLDDIKLFAVMSGDVNPAHVDEDYAASSRFHEVIAHGLWGGALISTVLGTQLPGPGTIYVSQSLQFRRPVGLGDLLTVTVTVTEKHPRRHRIVLDCTCANQEGSTVISGTAEVLAPTEKVRRPRWALPSVRLHERKHLHRLLDAAQAHPAIRVAVVHPVDAAALSGVLAASESGVVEPTLVGPEPRIRAAADAAGVDVTPYRIVPVAHSHAAAARATALARAGEVDALVQGSLGSDELLAAVLDGTTGLRTERRISHVFVFDVPTYTRPLLITDAVVNTYPTLVHKADIVRNAIDLAHALGIGQPRVAVLAAVETITPGVRSTLDAAALCKMADRHQITGGVVDGPLSFDAAVSPEAAAVNGVASPVAGQADVLVAPDVEAGNMLAEQLVHLGGADSAGVVLGARVPVVLSTPADAAISRLASCALAAMVVQQRRLPRGGDE